MFESKPALANDERHKSNLVIETDFDFDFDTQPRSNDLLSFVTDSIKRRRFTFYGQKEPLDGIAIKQKT